MKQVLVCILCLSISLHAFGQRNYNEPYSGKFLDRVAFPIGGMGAGMFCLEGTGAVSHMSVRHHMDFQRAGHVRSHPFERREKRLQSP